MGRMIIFFCNPVGFNEVLDCSHSPIFSGDRSYRHGYLDFQMYRGCGRRGL